jgi:hypothetical protein
MTKLILLNREILPEDDLANCNIVPLNSVAMRDVLRSKLNYIKIEDFIDYNFCKNNTDKLWQLCQQLLDKADEIVSEIYGDDKIKGYGPFNAFAKGVRQTFEYMAHSRNIINRIIFKCRPYEIKLLSRKVAYDVSVLINARYSDTLYKLVLESIANENNIDFKYESLEAKPDESLKKKRNIVLQGMVNMLKKTSFYYNMKIGHREKKFNKISEKALFLQHHWDVYYYSQYFENIINDLNIETYVVKNKDDRYKDNISCDEFLNKLQDQIAELNKYMGFDVGFILKATLERYIENIPLIMARAKRSEAYLNKIEPRYVFFTNLNDNMLPFQMALCWNNKIVKVMKEHGDSMGDFTIWRNTELKPTNLYLTEFEEMAEYFRNIGEQAHIPVRCEYDGVRLNKLYRKKKTKRKLVYVPSSNDQTIFVELSQMPQPLYYRVQLCILHILNQQNDIEDIVYKCLPPGTRNVHYPVPEYISKHFKNIRISYKPLKNELSDALFCLLDSPFSSMWEAINMDVPCQTLIWNKFQSRLSGAKYYEKFITYFDSDIDVADKLKLIMKNKNFQTIELNERKRMKRRPDEITAIFKNELSK